jgi:hypothetical protein
VETGVIILVLIILVFVAYAVVPTGRASPETLPPYRAVTIPCSENQRVMLLGELEREGIAYREVANSYHSEGLLTDRCYVLVPADDYERAVSLIKDLLEEPD